MKTKTIISKKDCGCINEITTTQIDENTTTTMVRNINTCLFCGNLKKVQDRMKKELGIFPNKTSKEVYDILDEMIDKLDEAGPDLSYFPHEAKVVLKETAIKIVNKLKQTYE